MRQSKKSYSDVALGAVEGEYEALEQIDPALIAHLEASTTLLMTC